MKKKNTVTAPQDSAEMISSKDVSSTNTDIGSEVKPSKGGEGCYLDEEGKISDQALHDQIMEGVSGQENVKYARELIGDTMSEADKDYYFPLK